LVNFEVEVVVLLSDGVDKLRIANDTKGHAEVLGHPTVMLLGLRSAATPSRPASLCVEKGGILSRADDTVAFCVAHRVIDLMEERCAADPGAREGLRVLDPMCGVGTYLMALQWLMSRRGAFRPNLLGVELESEAVEHLRGNAARAGCPVNVIRGSSIGLPIRDDSIDLILVDPPWGMRHSSHNYVKRYFPRWVREWARVLRPGGAAVVVTICKKVFEAQALLPLQGVLEIEEAVQFDNKGFTVCRMYVVRKARHESGRTAVGRRDDATPEV